MLVTGATGLLGSAVCRAACAADIEVLAGTHRDRGPGSFRRIHVELTDDTSVAEAVGLADTVVHTAYSKGGPGSRAINVDAAAGIARMCAERGTPLIHVSSDAVFDGHPPRAAGYREQDPARPVRGYTYGEEKAEAEQLVLGAHRAATAVRTSLLYDLAGNSSLERMVLRSASAGSGISHFLDEYRSPVHVEDVAEAIVALSATAGRSRPPVIHLGGPQRLSRAEIAQGLAPHLGLDPLMLPTAPSASVAGDRPGDLTLDSSLARDLLGYDPRPLGS